MGDVDQGLRPLPGGPARQIRDAEFGHDQVGLGARHGHNRSLRQHGGDAGFDSACFFVRIGGVAADEGHSAFGHVSAGLHNPTARRYPLMWRGPDDSDETWPKRSTSTQALMEIMLFILAHDMGGIGVGHRV